MCATTAAADHLFSDITEPQGSRTSAENSDRRSPGDPGEHHKACNTECSVGRAFDARQHIATVARNGGIVRSISFWADHAQ
jgi:hypothetical protein